MNDVTLDLCEMVNEPSEYIFSLKEEHPRVYAALVDAYHKKELFSSIETMIHDTKEKMTTQDVGSRCIRLAGVSESFTIPDIQSYQEYETIYNQLEDKYRNPGSGYGACTMGRGMSKQKLDAFVKYYQGYESRRQAYLV